MYRKETVTLGETNISFIVKTNSDSETWIPMDDSNSDYQTYLRWVENPNAPEFQTPWVEPQLTK